MYDKLREAVCEANIELDRQGLVVCSWGNVSGIDRAAGVVAIKPSGVSYEDLTPDKIVPLDLDGNVLEGGLRPSSDTPTHLELYRNFESIGGICHTHSLNATMWAQACREIPCFGTTHADYFYGPIPVTEAMTEDEIQSNYELNTGKVIVRRFVGMDPVGDRKEERSNGGKGKSSNGVDPMKMPAVLVANHGPFTWGSTPAGAVEAAFVLEQVAAMAAGTVMINASQGQISRPLLDKHYLRKHGKDAYYGQKRQEN